MNFEYSKDLFVLNITSGDFYKQKTKGIKIPRLKGHSVFNIQSKMYLIGGETKQGFSHRVFVLDLDSFIWKEIHYEGYL